jgi:hypothetical protein
VKRLYTDRKTSYLRQVQYGSIDYKLTGREIISKTSRYTDTDHTQTEGQNNLRHVGA